MKNGEIPSERANKKLMGQRSTITGAAKMGYVKTGRSPRRVAHSLGETTNHSSAGPHWGCIGIRIAQSDCKGQQVKTEF